VEKTKVEVKPDSVGVRPNTLILRPMEYKHPIGVTLYFWGLFGCDADSKGENDIWVGTFYDRNEAETFILASKSYGQLVNGVRLSAQQATPKLEVIEGATRIESGDRPPATEG
jgi:hypothetical protein